VARKKKPVDEPKKKSKFKAKARIEDDEDDADEDDDANDGVVRVPKTGNDAYTGMLLIGLICLVAACVLLFLDTGEVTAQPLSAPNVAVPALGNAAAAPVAVPAAAPADGI